MAEAACKRMSLGEFLGELYEGIAFDEPPAETIDSAAR